MVELVDTRDLKSRGPGRVRAGSSPAPGTKINNLVSAPYVQEFKTGVCYCAHNCAQTANLAVGRKGARLLRVFRTMS
jgi:hypothetical protein